MYQFFLLAFLEVKLFFLSIDGVSLSSYFVLSLYLLCHQFLSSILLPFRDELLNCNLVSGEQMQNFAIITIVMTFSSGGRNPIIDFIQGSFLEISQDLVVG